MKKHSTGWSEDLIELKKQINKFEGRLMMITQTQMQRKKDKKKNRT